MASKSKRRRRVLGASCILAALIVAGSSFAWFTSKDEVTNRLSANADYGVSIVESFAPPKNFLPGQKINKDVYAVNTGNIAAFVKESVTTQLSITKEVPVTVTMKTDNGATTVNEADQIDTLTYNSETVNLTDCIELDYDEIYVTEAGSYLAWKPADSKAADLGDLVVEYNDQYDPKTKTYQYVATDIVGTGPSAVTTTYYITEDQYNAAFVGTEADPATNSIAGKDKNDKDIPNGTDHELKTDKTKWSKVEVPPSKTDFTPDVEGLYVFRRAIDVDKMNAEEFDYAAYYYKDGHYYKVDNLAVTPDGEIDLSNDGVTTDGQLASATFDLVKDVTEVVVPTLTYDKANNRLIATYGGYADDAQNTIIGTGAANSGDLTELANKLDKAEHEWVEKRAALEAALNEKAVSDANVAKDMAAIQALQAELDEVNAKIAELTGSINGYTPKVNAQDTLANTTDKNALESALSDLYGSAHSHDYDYTLNDNDADDKITYTENSSDTDSTAGVDGKYKDYLKAKREYNEAKTNYAGDKYNAYLAELVAKYTDASDATLDSTKKAALTQAGSDKDLDAAIEIIGYEILKDNVDFEDGTELHDLYTKSVAFLKAELEYKQAKKAAEDAFKTYKKDMDLLGNGKTQEADTATHTTIAGYDVDYKEYSVVKDGDATPAPAAGDDNTYGMREQLAELNAEKSTLENKKAALEGAIDSANQQAISDATYSGTTGTAADNLATAKTAYNDAYKNYVAAQNAYNKRKADYDAAKNLKIYINLADVVTEGGIAEKWQIVPVGTIDADATTANTDTAEFFYTSILPAGATSTKLIDSVELDESTTQDMYKSFDFDINVGLDSRQIAYAQNDPTLITTTQLDGFGADVILDNYHSEDAVLTWSQSTTNVDVTVTGKTENNVIKMVKTGTGSTATWTVAETGTAIVDATDPAYYTINGVTDTHYSTVAALTAALNALTGDTAPTVEYHNS